MLYKVSENAYSKLYNIMPPKKRKRGIAQNKGGSPKRKQSEISIEFRSPWEIMILFRYIRFLSFHR